MKKHLFYILPVLVLLWVSFTALHGVKQDFALMVDEFSIPIQEVTFGEGNSDVVMQGVPQQYLSVKPTENGFCWQVNLTQNRDTLEYFKINNKNPNNHSLSSNDILQVKLGNSTENFPVDDINQLWKKEFDGQEYVMLRHMIARLHQKNELSDYTNYIDNDTLRSFFYRKDGTISMVILDKFTTIHSTQEGDVTYCESGSIDTDYCEVQFYRVGTYCYKTNESNDDFFRIDGVNYVMKPTVKLTEWGAGHVMLRKQGDSNLRILFPKAIGYVGCLDTLRTMASQSAGSVTIRQTKDAYPTGADLCLPHFCGAISQDLLNLELDHGDTIVVRDNNNAEYVVNDARTFSWLPISLLPSLSRYELKSGRSTVVCRMGVIDNSFAFSYMCLPLLVLLILLLITWWPWSPFRGWDDYYIDNGDQLRSYPFYMTGLLVVAFCYCACKSMIAMKLSYTYPYFEKLTAITPMNTAMMLLLAYTLGLLFNISLVFFPHKKNGTTPNCWLTLCMLASLFTVLVAFFFGIMDEQLSRSMLASYVTDETDFFSNWLFGSAYGVNDNHRTVPYALISMEGGALALLFCSHFPSLRNLPVRLWSWLKEWLIHKPRGLSNIFDKLIDEGAESDYGKLSWSKRMARWIQDLKSHLPAASICMAIAVLLGFVSSLLGVGCIALALAVLLVDPIHDGFLRFLQDAFPIHFILWGVLITIGNVFGNFSTAFITLIVVVGYTNALSNVKFRDPQEREHVGLRAHAVFFEMLFFSIFYIVCAMVGDNGYLTNYLGLFVGMIFIFHMIERPAFERERGDIARKKETLYISIVMALFVVATFSMQYIVAHISDPGEVNQGRMERRLNLYSNFKDLQQAGYRYSQGDAEFMVVMNHCMQRPDGETCSDALCPDHHPLHASVSTGQSPVVLNDVSLPMAFVSPYGVFSTTFIFFALLALLSLGVFNFSMEPIWVNGKCNRLTQSMQWRLLAMCMWVGTSLYIYLSYLGWLPFTGRLNPGYGVDAVGEALETALLLAFMSSVSVVSNEN